MCAMRPDSHSLSLLLQQVVGNKVSVAAGSAGVICSAPSHFHFLFVYHAQDLELDHPHQSSPALQTAKGSQAFPSY
jgi:hypothetical protein